MTPEEFDEWCECPCPGGDGHEAFPAYQIDCKRCVYGLVVEQVAKTRRDCFGVAKQTPMYLLWEATLKKAGYK